MYYHWSPSSPVVLNVFKECSLQSILVGKVASASNWDHVVDVHHHPQNVRLGISMITMTKAMSHHLDHHNVCNHHHNDLGEIGDSCFFCILHPKEGHVLTGGICHRVM